MFLDVHSGQTYFVLILLRNRILPGHLPYFLSSLFPRTRAPPLPGPRLGAALADDAWKETGNGLKGAGNGLKRAGDNLKGAAKGLKEAGGSL